MKPVIIFNFGYNRKGWIAPIESLKDSIEIVYLYYINKAEEQLSYTRHRVIYWNDYENANQLLDDIKPDKVVFMGLESGLGILLNFKARQKQIPTYILQHGIYSNYKDYRERENRIELTAKEPMQSPSLRSGTLWYFIKSLTPLDYLRLIKFPAYVVLMKLRGFRFASRWIRFRARKPDYYICYTPQNAIIHKELDGAPESKLLYIGYPEMDSFMNYRGTDGTKGNYYLLIDQPLADNRYREHLMTREQMIAHYLKLCEFCEKQNSRLAIKLHPESYHSDWLPKNDRIEWIRDHENLPKLVREARGCFGYFSSLITPAICMNNVVLFKVSNNEMQQDAARWGLAQLLDFFTFSVDQIDFDGIRKNDLNIFTKKYLYFEDGNSTDRLKKILVK